jgi:hypothetical protein
MNGPIDDYLLVDATARQSVVSVLDDGRFKGHPQLVPQRIEPALAQQLEYFLLPEVGVFLVGRVADGDLVREVEALVDQVSH